VDKVVEKLPLTSRNASIDAPPNKLHIRQALFCAIKIKDLGSDVMEVKYFF
jgi:hypothetical protein